MDTEFRRLKNAFRNPGKAIRDIKKHRLYKPRMMFVFFHPSLRKVLHPGERKRVYELLLPYFEGQKGIRIGGSHEWYFQDLVSYAQVVDVDIQKFHRGRHTHADYVTDATNLDFASDGEFDFVCSNHVLEHIANPLKAIYEWSRVLKDGGIIYCGVPDKRFTFDRKRERTKLSHLISDYEKDVPQDDPTHIDESLNWDVSMSRGVKYADFQKYILDNPATAVHHHVWVKEDIAEIFDFAGLELVYITLVGNTIHVVGRKMPF